MMKHPLTREQKGPPPIRFTWKVLKPGYLALHRAITSGNTEEVNQLLTSASKEILERRDIRGRTALHIAVVADKYSSCKCLLEAGADPEAQDNHGHTPLMVAAGEGKQTFAKLLLKHGADPNAHTPTGATVLNGAVSECREELVLLLLNHGADIGSDEASPLHVCVSVYCTDCDQQVRQRIFDLLVDRGANIEAQPELGATPLALAAFMGDYESAKKLLQSGARHDVSCPGMGGMHPLHIAISSNQARVANLLIDAGAAVNATSSDGNTPLIYASSQREMVTVVKKLLERGAAVNVKNAEGNTAIDVASANNNREIINVLSK